MPKKIALPGLLTLRQASQLLQVHANTLRNWERSGRIQSVRIGPRRDRRFTKQALSQVYQVPGASSFLAE